MNEIEKQKLYKKFIAKDAAFDGFVYACVKTTGIFCKFTCPARKPNIENVEFVKTPNEAMKKNYRACKRCRPLETEVNYAPITKTLLEELRKDPTNRWDGEKIRKLGLDVDSARRAFNRDFGTSFLKFARDYRLGSVIANIENGEKIIEAQLDAGFSSSSGFFEAIKRNIGTSPSNLANISSLNAKWIDTPIGPMLSIVDDNGVHLLEFFERKGLSTELEKLKKKTAPICFRNHPMHEVLECELAQYFAGNLKVFRVKNAQFGTKFEKTVWEQLKKIPFGTTRSYGEQAIAINNPNAVRAVARANGSNKLAIIVPCHRVIGADGSMTGYAGKIWRKEWLLNHERKFSQSVE